MPFKDPEKRRLMNKEYLKRHYKKHKEEVIRKQHELNVALAAEITELKEKTPCQDCGKNYPGCVMEFDHRPGEKKIKAVAQLISYGRNKVYEEIAKCDLVCANCHRIRTHILRAGIVFNG